MIVCSCISNAQNNRDAVYLKNGNIIKGTVIEMVTNDYVKLLAQDGSQFIFKMEDVLKIEKEQVEKQVQESTSPSTPDSYNAYRGRRFNTMPHRRYDNDYYVDVKRVWRPKGYRAFFDISYSENVDDDCISMMTLSTSHGYQLNPNLFIGAGLGLNFMDFPNYYYSWDGYYYDDDLDINIPIYANVRVNFLKTRITPYVDARIGYAAGDYDGFYFSSTLGCDFAITPKFDLYVSLGYTFLQPEDEYIGYNYHNDGNFFTFNFGLHY